MKKYIIYVGGMEFPSKNAAAQRVMGVASLLKKIGFVTVFSGVNKEWCDEDIIKTKKEVFGYEVYEVPYPSSARDWAKHIVRVDNVEKLIKRYNPKKIQAIIAYNYPGIAMARMIQLCRKNDIRFISDCTEWYGDSKRKFPENMVKNFDTFLRMRFVNTIAKNVICASEYMEKYYNDRGCMTVNIPSLVDNLNTKWSHARDAYVPNKPRTLVYAGSPGLSVEKDRLDWVIKALHKLKLSNVPFVFNIIGITKDSYLSIFPDQKKQIEDLKDFIVFHGRLPHDMAIEFIKKSDYSIFFRSINRVTAASFPTKVAESLGCGVPVITNRTSNIGAYIEDGKTGFISKGSSMDELHSTLLKALKISDTELAEMNQICLFDNPLHIKRFYDPLFAFMNNLR